MTKNVCRDLIKRIIYPRTTFGTIKENLIPEELPYSKISIIYAN